MFSKAIVWVSFILLFYCFWLVFEESFWEWISSVLVDWLQSFKREFGYNASKENLVVNASKRSVWRPNKYCFSYSGFQCTTAQGMVLFFLFFVSIIGRLISIFGIRRAVIFGFSSKCKIDEVILKLGSAIGINWINTMYLDYDVCLVVTCQGKWIEFAIDINWN